MHFEQNRNYQFNECPKCNAKTKKKRIHFEDILNEETQRLVKIKKSKKESY